MGKDVVMVHGANCGGWCFDEFRKVFEARGFTCHTPDLIGHGADKATAKVTLANIGMADYREQMAAFSSNYRRSRSCSAIPWGRSWRSSSRRTTSP
jgi:pimeloyl-ACP methyl ester carboxylesterase